MHESRQRSVSLHNLQHRPTFLLVRYLLNNNIITRQYAIFTCHLVHLITEKYVVVYNDTKLLLLNVIKRLATVNSTLYKAKCTPIPIPSACKNSQYRKKCESGCVANANKATSNKSTHAHY